MKERQKHIDAFDTYYGLGTKRSLIKLHQHLTKTALKGEKVPALRTLKEWSHEFSWQQRIILQDRELNQKTKKRIVNEEIDVRVAAHKSVMQTRDMFLASIGTAFYKDKKTGKNIISPDVAISSARELKDMLLGVIKCEEAGLHILAPQDELKHTGTIEITTPQLDPKIAKEAAKLITKLQSEQSIAKKTKT